MRSSKGLPEPSSRSLVQRTPVPTFNRLQRLTSVRPWAYDTLRKGSSRSLPAVPRSKAAPARTRSHRLNQVTRRRGRSLAQRVVGLTVAAVPGRRASRLHCQEAVGAVVVTVRKFKTYRVAVGLKVVFRTRSLVIILQRGRVRITRSKIMVYRETRSAVPRTRSRLVHRPTSPIRSPIKGLDRTRLEIWARSRWTPVQSQPIPAVLAPTGTPANRLASRGRTPTWIKGQKITPGRLTIMPVAGV